MDYPIYAGKTIPIVGLNPYQIQNGQDSLKDYFSGKMVPIPMALRGHSYIPFDVFYFFPNDAYLNTFYRTERNAGPFGLFCKILSDNKAELVFDSNADFNYNDEKKDTILTNTEILLTKVFSFSDNGKKYNIEVPFNVHLFSEDNKFVKLDIQNLLMYELRYKLGPDSLKIDINTHNHFVNCRYVQPGKDSIISFRIGEPFLFKKTWFELQNLNLCENTVDLVELSGDKIYGYSEGQYVSMTELKRITDQHYLTEDKVDWEAFDFYLLHFWGEWCSPCVVEVPKIVQLESQLKKKNKVQIVHFPFVYRKDLLQRTIQFIEESNMSGPQSLCGAMDCEPDDLLNETCFASNYLRISSFPSYILVDKFGKIHFKSNLQMGPERLDKLTAELHQKKLL